MQSRNNKLHFKKSAIAVMTAMYVGASGLAVATPDFKKVPNSSLHEPSISVADIQNLKTQKKQQNGPEAASLTADIGVLNQQYKNAQPQAVFTAAKASQGEQTYIVQFEERPVASYEGGVNGYTATAQKTTRTFVGRSPLNMQASNVKRYQHYLQNRQQAAVASAQSYGASIEVSKQFTVANNAAVVRMTQADALLLAKQSGVKKITPNRILELQTDRGPEFIGADKVWSGEVTPQGVGSQGEGMIVGIIDTGINTDHIAFASDAQYEQMNPLGTGNFIGDCVEEASLCNDKLIGVRSYEEITKANSDYIFASEDRRPENGEDYNGHGSHTASTAAGNYLENTPMQQITGEKVSDGEDLPFNFPKTSGVAPRAHIVSYQACYAGNADDPYVGCPESAILSAFEDAIADGVDVINFSIGGGESFSWDDPIELAFLNARKAGIHVAAAAGNSGPAYYSADHASPWVTTVGAAHHDRVISLGEKSITNFQGDGAPADISGKSFTGSITGQVVLAENYSDPDETDEYEAKMCNAPFAEGTFTSDQIVVCLRGDAPRVDKAKNVAAGGAGGFILQNVDYNADNLVAEQYVIPGIQISRTARWKLRNWVNDNAEQAIATITAGENIYTTDEELGNQLAPFSSMGPSRYINNLVPDVAAPGVDIYAANADEQPFTSYPSASDWTMMSGTSMATPHVAGAMTLLASIHPDWTPAQLQSALMMTAKPVTIALATGIQAPYYTFMGGAGSIDVANAAQAGLIMDETIENYIDANPNNGGLAQWLNVPSMVNMDCELSCSWVRTVTATQDGSWQVDGRAWAADGRSDEVGLSINVQPQSFSLKAGESQDVRVTMNLPNIIEHKLDPTEDGAPWDIVQNQEVWFNGEVTFVDLEGDAPDAHLPIAARNHLDELPLSVDMNVARETGSETLLVNTDSYSQLTPRYYGLVAPTRVTATIEDVSPFVTKENVEKGWHIQSIEVPEGAKRLVVKNEKTHILDDEVVADPRYQNFYSHVMVGFDANENGSFMISDEEIAEYEGALKDALYDEMVCYSSSMSESNYCNIVDPAPGKYWLATATINAPSSEYEVTTHYAIVTDEDKGNLAVEGPSSHDGNGNYALKVNWMMPESQVGETYYGGFDLGDMPGGEGSLGFTALNIHRDADVLTMDVNQDKARAMDVVDVNVKLKANYESDTRDYHMTLEVPEGLRLAEQTLQSNNEQVAELLEVEGNTITLSGAQLSTRNIKREYKLSSNLTDQMCRTPQIDEQSDGGYIDLFGEFGLQPNAEWMVGGAGDYEDVPIDWLFYKEGADFKMYNQPSINSMRMHAVGAIQTTPFSWVMSQHRGPGFLTEALAPFWRGSFEMDYLRHWEDPHGLTIATQYADERPDLGDLLFLEYDNVTDSESGDSYDFQAILRSGYDDHQNQFEIIYAYDNLGDNLAEGAIFVEGGDSSFSRTAGFKEGALFTMVGYNTLDNVLKDDLVLCFDYVGPEQSEVEFSFKAAVKPEAKGTQQDIKLDYQLGSATSQTMTHSIAVQSNLKISALDDMTIAENGRIDDIEVMVLDADQSPNELVISGEHISAEVDGMSFNLIPEPNFFGETQVTVTVQDKADSSDQASTEFMLTVTSDGIELGCTDPTAINFDASANTDDGSCQYEEVAETKDKDSGSFGYIVLLILPLLAARRRKSLGELK